tara:strand:- start:100 stop:393 length:294 start_codon:yes stop_codon:yes gene_type:complete
MTDTAQKQTLISRYWWLCLLVFLIGFTLGGGWEILNVQEWSYDIRYRAQDQSEVIQNVLMWMLLRGPGLGFLFSGIVLAVLLAGQSYSNKKQTKTGN